MVDVSSKRVTIRRALAEARLRLPETVRAAMKGGDFVTAKGPVFHTAIIAGTQAAKKTSELIPFCHPIPIERCHIALEARGGQIIITCEVTTTGKTGVEMEALTGASIAALTVYDMTKALSHEMVVESIQLVKKSGGRHNLERECAP